MLPTAESSLVACGPLATGTTPHPQLYNALKSLENWLELNSTKVCNYGPSLLSSTTPNLGQLVGQGVIMGKTKKKLHKKAFADCTNNRLKAKAPFDDTTTPC